MHRLAIGLIATLILPAGVVRSAEPEPEVPSPPGKITFSEEPDVLGEVKDTDESAPTPTEPTKEGDPDPGGASVGDEGDIFSGDGGSSDCGVFDTVRDDPLAIGGQLYMRLGATIFDRGSFGEQTLSMPNLLDIYLDARPEERVRGFFSGRLSYDPTITDGATDPFGQSRESTRVVLDQLWIKTDIERRVYLTLGQERIKWGPSRLWNPNDFVNARRRDPLTLFDERTGVPMLKVHIPVETFNFYVIGLVGDADRFDEPGAAFRFEGAFDSTEMALSGVAGKGRKTAFGFDISTALGPVDFTAEVSLSDETDTLEYSGKLDVSTFEIPTATKRDAWMARVSAGLQYAFKPNDDDVMYLGVEYFWNPLGVTDKDLYPWLLINGELEPFYAGQHYLGLVWLIPQPGTWQDTTFTFSALGNLSDTSFITRLDMSQTVHTRLRLETYVQGHFGTRGGEFRFALDVPDLPPIPDLLPDGLEAFSVPASAVLFGLNLRLSI